MDRKRKKETETGRQRVPQQFKPEPFRWESRVLQLTTLVPQEILIHIKTAVPSPQDQRAERKITGLKQTETPQDPHSEN